MVLVVDDNEDALDLYAVGLSLQGLAVRVAGSAGEALSLIDVRLPQVVVTDLSMPGVDGLEFCRRIRAREYGRHLPIVVVSANDDPVQRLALGNIGVCSVLTKPVGPQELGAAIRDLLSNRHMCATCSLQAAPLLRGRTSLSRVWSKHP